MRIKLDENLPAGIAPLLETLGHDAETVPGEGLAGAPDERVAEATRGEGRILVTQDIGIADRRVHPPGSHPGILLLRLRLPGAHALRGRLEQVFRTEDTAAWAGAVVVVTDTKIRVVSPARESRGGGSGPSGP